MNQDPSGLRLEGIPRASAVCPLPALPVPVLNILVALPSLAPLLATAVCPLEIRISFCFCLPHVSISALAKTVLPGGISEHANQTWLPNQTTELCLSQKAGSIPRREVSLAPRSLPPPLLMCCPPGCKVRFQGSILEGKCMWFFWYRIQLSLADGEGTREQRDCGAGWALRGIMGCPGTKY